MIITEILARNARNFPEKEALIECDPKAGSRTSITWNEFNDTSNQFSNALISKQVRKGDKIVQLMTNSLNWLPIYFGILKTGAWVVPLNFRFLEDKIKLCTKTADAKIVVFGEEFTDRIDNIRQSLRNTVKTYIYSGSKETCPEFAIPYETFISNHPDIDPRIELDITDNAALYFTSGTTGVPKAVLLTHRNLESSCIVENTHHRQSHDDIFLCIPPLYHTGAKMHWFGSFIMGATSVLLKGVKPEWIIETASRENVSIVWLLVPWAYDILNAVDAGKINLSKYDLKNWRLMHIGAQPVPGSLVNKWLELFPNQEYDTNYGLTEATGPGCVHLGKNNIHKTGAIGIPGFDWECKIVDRKAKIVPLGEPGELMIKGPGVMKEYYKNPVETEKVIQKGWLLTGDIARKDKDGFIWLLDRKKDVIITGGENIYPVEIEDFLMTHSKIKDVAVIGFSDERLGEIVMAVISVKEGMDIALAEVSSFCEGLAKYKRPRKIIFGDVPRNPTGKIEKPLLRKKYSGKTGYFNRNSN